MTITEPNVKISNVEPEDFDPQYYVTGCFLEWRAKENTIGRIVTLKRLAEKTYGTTWGLPAGKLEPHEIPKDPSTAPAEGMRRELWEETGYRQAIGDSLTCIEKTFVRDVERNVDFVYYTFHLICRQSEKPEIKLERREHSEHKWVTPAEALRHKLIPGLATRIQSFYGL